MAAILVGFQMVGLPDFRSHSESGPFANQPLFDHSKSGQGRISDTHCTQQWKLWATPFCSLGGWSSLQWGFPGFSPFSPMGIFPLEKDRMITHPIHLSFSMSYFVRMSSVFSVQLIKSASRALCVILSPTHCYYEV